MTALDRKLLRDLVHIWPQALAIALVMAAGVATLILAQGAHRSLDETRAAYYDRYRFADVFASAKRAPKDLLAAIREIPGIAAVEARARGSAVLDVEGVMEPASAQLLSLPETGAPRLNALYLRRGRLPNGTGRDEVAVNTAFAKVHELEPGSTIHAVVGGTARDLRVVGIVDSPEFIYTIGPGELAPDDRRSAILWMPERELAAAYDLEGAFNDLIVGLLRGADLDEVTDRLDILLKPYGGRGAHGRKDQVSHAFIDAELNQLRAMAVILPPIFLAVAAFLINMTLARIISMEREQIGLLKALGYANRTIGAHYVKFALIIALTGLALGCVGGWWLGRGLTRIYAEFFKFPFLFFTDAPDPYVIAAAVAFAAGTLGALQAVARAVRLAPAVAMRPPAPPAYRRLPGGARRLLPEVSQLSLMILRQLIRHPGRAGLTMLGMALSVAILVGSLFSLDSLEDMVDVTFFRTDRQDATITFLEPQPLRAVEDVRRLPGVLKAEPQRSVAVRIRHANIERRISLSGKRRDADLARVLDLGLRDIRPDEYGVMLSQMLAKLLHVGPGGRVEFEALEGRGLVWSLPVVAISTGYVGLGASVDFDALNRMMHDPPLVGSVGLSLDRAAEPAFFAAIKDVPALSGITLNRRALQTFRDTIAENINIAMTMYLSLGGLIAFGVVYNTARIRLSERGRELASLRVLGFTRSEIYWVLFGEFLILVLLALPLGWVLGYGIAAATVAGLANELYQMPLIILPATYARAALVVLVAAAISAILLRVRTDRLDLIAVLKTRE